jgi:hypothetical protein
MSRAYPKQQNFIQRKKPISSQLKLPSYLSSSKSSILYKDIAIKKNDYSKRKLQSQTYSESKMSLTFNPVSDRKKYFKTYTSRNETSSDLDKYRSQMRVNKLFERISETKRDLNRLTYRPKMEPSYSNKYKERSNQIEKNILNKGPQMKIIGEKERVYRSTDLHSSLILPSSGRYSFNKDLIGQRLSENHFTKIKNEVSKNKSKYNIKKNYNKNLKKYNSYAKFQNYNFNNVEKSSSKNFQTPKNNKKITQLLLPERFSLDRETRTQKNPYLFNSIQKFKKPEQNGNINLYQSYSKFPTIDNSNKKNKNQMDIVEQREINKNDIYFNLEVISDVICGRSNGKDKVCQDQVLNCNFYVDKRQYFVFAVFDGHGRFGERISDFLKKNISSTIKNELLKINNNKNKIIPALKEAINKMHSDILEITSKVTRET